MTSASVLIVLLVGTVVGALVGLLLGGTMENWYLALLAGFLGSTIAVIIRNLVLSRGAGLGPDNSKTPGLVAIYAARLVTRRWKPRVGDCAAQRPRRHAGLDRDASGPVRVDPARHADGHLPHEARKIA